MSVNHRPVDFELLLPEVGLFGRYQIFLYALLNLAMGVQAPFQILVQIFLQSEPYHWCSSPDQQIHTILSPDEARYLTVPPDEDSPTGYSKCDVYVGLNFTQLALKREEFGEDEWKNFIEEKRREDSWETGECNHWEYDKTWYENTFLSEWDLVCENAHVPATVFLIFNLGSVFGTPIFGYLQDRFGRRLSFFVCLLCNIVFSVCSSLAWNPVSLCIFRFLTGLTIPTCFQIPILIALELLPSSKRVFGNMVGCICFSLGFMLLGSLAHFFRDWRDLTLITSLPFCVMFLYWWVLPESPRWLLANKKDAEMESLLQVIARWNNKKIPRNYLDKKRAEIERDELGNEELNSLNKHIHETCENTNNHQLEQANGGTNPILVEDTIPRPLHLIRTRNMRKKFMAVTFCWVANVMVYHGLSYVATSVGTENPYLTFITSGAVEIPGYLIAWLLVAPLGRKWPLIVSMFLAGTFLISTVAAPDITALLIALNMLGKCAICASFAIIYLWAIELYPTVIRGMGLGITLFSATLAVILLPYLVYLKNYSIVLPFLILGALSILSGIACIFCPETTNTPLPTTLEDGELFGADQPLCYWGFRTLNRHTGTPAKSYDEASHYTEMNMIGT